MISWFKRHFIPHKNNDHKPHFLRGKNIRNVIIIVLFLEIFTFLIPTLSHINRTGGLAAVLPAVLADLTNQERQADKLAPLTVSPILNKAAEMKATDMATYGYFAHTSPTGKTPWYWLSLAGYDYQYAGENLAINFTDSKDVTTAWMNSPTHKANIIKGNYTEIGTGVATGIYQGKSAIFVAQVYANPISKQAQPISTTTIKEIKSNILPVKVLNTNGPVNVLGAETSATIKDTNTSPEVVTTPTISQRLMASPRNTTNKALIAIFAIITISLILNIFIKIKIQHFYLITNGLITLVIIAIILTTNYYLSNYTMSVSESIDYTNQGMTF